MIRILKSFLVICGVVGVVAGATGAYFSDTVVSENNSFTTGTLDIMLDELHPSHKVISEVFPLVGMMPGVESDLIRQGIALAPGSVQPDHLEVRVRTNNFVDPDTDSTADDLKKMIILTDFSMNGGPDWVWYGFNQHTFKGNDGDASSLSLYDVESAGILDDVPMNNPTRELRMKYKLSEVAGNEFQGDSIQIDFEIGAAQVAGQSVLVP